MVSLGVVAISPLVVSIGVFVRAAVVVDLTVVVVVVVVSIMKHFLFTVTPLDYIAWCYVASKTKSELLQSKHAVLIMKNFFYLRSQSVPTKSSITLGKGILSQCTLQYHS